jgi:hypothetical protein
MEEEEEAAEGQQAGSSEEKEAARGKATHSAETDTQTHRSPPVTDSPPGRQLKTKGGSKGEAWEGEGRAGVRGKGKTYGAGMRNGGVGGRDREREKRDIEAKEVHDMWQSAAKV